MIRKLGLLVIGAIGGVVLWFTLIIKTDALAPSVTPTPSATATTNHSKGNSPSVESTSPLLELQPVAHKELYSTPRPAKEPYHLLGYGSTGRIEDSNGKVLIQSGPESGIYIAGFQVSPDGKRIYVDSSESEDFVLDTNDGQRIPLPSYPPAASAMGRLGVLESWNWVENSTLIAKVSEWKPKEESTRFDDDETNIVRTRLYLYSLSDGKLTEVKVPGSLSITTFDIKSVNRNGEICLFNPAVGSDGNLGCFAVRRR